MLQRPSKTEFWDVELWNIILPCTNSCEVKNADFARCSQATRKKVTWKDQRRRGKVQYCTKSINHVLNKLLLNHTSQLKSPETRRVRYNREIAHKRRCGKSRSTELLSLFLSGKFCQFFIKTLETPDLAKIASNTFWLRMMCDKR